MSSRIIVGLQICANPRTIPDEARTTSVELGLTHGIAKPKGQNYLDWAQTQAYTEINPCESFSAPVPQGMARGMMKPKGQSYLDKYQEQSLSF